MSYYPWHVNRWSTNILTIVLADMSAANTNNFFWVVILSVVMHTHVNNRKISARCSCRIWWHARVYCWLWWWSWWCRSYPGFIKCRKESWCKTSRQGILLYWFNIDSIPGYSSRSPTISILHWFTIWIQYCFNTRLALFCRTKLFQRSSLRSWFRLKQPLFSYNLVST